MKSLTGNVRDRLLPILLAQGAGLVCGVVGVRLTSQWVDPADFGRYGVFTSLVPVAPAVLFVGLGKYVARHWAAEPDRPGFARQVLALAARRLPWLLVAAGLAALAAAPGHPLAYGLAFFAGAALVGLANLGQTALQAAREHWRDLGVSGATSLGRSFLPPLLYQATGAGLRALLVGFVAHAVIAAAFAWSGLRRQLSGPPPAAPRPAPPREYTGLHFIVPAIAGWILLGLNRWLVALFFGAEAAGYFTLAGNIGLILPAMLSVTMQQYGQPGWFAAAHALPAERRALLRRIDAAALLYTGLALGATAALHAALPLLVGPVINPRYLPAADFVLLTGCYTTALSLNSFYHLLLLAARREPACTRVDLAGAAVLAAGSVAGAAAGPAWFRGWLLAAPLVPWLVNRTLARAALGRD